MIRGHIRIIYKYWVSFPLAVSKTRSLKVIVYREDSKNNVRSIELKKNKSMDIFLPIAITFKK